MRTPLPLHPLLHPRSAGVLLPLSALPGPHRRGSLGAPARRFVDWLAAAGVRWWQMLPVCPPGPDGSPYSSPAALEGDLALLPRSAEQTQAAFRAAWAELRAYARARGIGLIGDLPLYVMAGSKDVRNHPELFRLDRSGRPRVLTGVPPDSFSADGQLWGHPHYAWAAHRSSGYSWWLRRFAIELERFDLVRVDHFIGLVRAWEVPADARTARRGRWRRVPGRELLSALHRKLRGPLPLIAEDLGALTPAVIRLRQDYGLLGMRLLQNAFAPGAEGMLPHALPADCVVYPGTHDNDTVRGWFRRLSASERKRVLAYGGGRGAEIPWTLVRLAMTSPARLAMVPAQDLLGLGSRARLNRPGTRRGNWQWRAPAGAFTPALARRLRELLEAADRVACPGERKKGSSSKGFGPKESVATRATSPGTP